MSWDDDWYHYFIREREQQDIAYNFLEFLFDNITYFKENSIRKGNDKIYRVNNKQYTLDESIDMMIVLCEELLGTNRRECKEYFDKYETLLKFFKQTVFHLWGKNR